MVLAPASLLPSNSSFAGHKTFALRSGWLKKGGDALADTQPEGTSLFNRDDALVILGVGKNMVQSIRHWLLVTRMVEESATTRGREIRLTPLGSALLGSPDDDGWDAFLEDDATLWLLHWQLAGPNSLAFSWAYTFNRFREYDFSKDNLIDAIQEATAGAVAKPLSRETIMRDVECLLHTYLISKGSANTEDNLDCPLQSLGLIRPSYSRHFRFQFGPKISLPLPIFVYAMLTFWEWKQPTSESLSAWDITYAEGSPGQVFKLDDDSVMEYLDEIENVTKGAFSFEDTGIQRDVIRNSTTPFAPLTLLETYYHA